MTAATFVRPDGKEKVTGSGRYTADLNLTGQLHAKLRYADHTHARIVRIDTTKARALPGVLAVLTHEDVPDVRYGIMVKDRRLFAKERVRFEADVVVKGRYLVDASQGAPIEPRAILADWQGDRVNVWSSTQVPFAARSGIARVLKIPESNVRVIVPLLGGGFGSKCDFHFEGHVAALARAAGRPVKLVFTREEEFVAPDHRREGMVIELETGARQDGTIVARRGRLVLDGGAYCGEGGFFAQLAAMHACGPYVIENVHIESRLVYTNNQPSGSIRAPTAPQTCWAVEQHMDELARALDLDPGQLRRRTLLEEGSEGPTRQVFGPLGIKQTLERAVELIDYGRELPEGEAVGVACGWWPSFGGESGAYLKLNGDGTGTIVHGAA